MEGKRKENEAKSAAEECVWRNRVEKWFYEELRENIDRSSRLFRVGKKKERISIKFRLKTKKIVQTDRMVY